MQTIYQGDCREVMKGFGRESVHLIVTSPPYNVGIDFGGHNDNLDKDEYVSFTCSWLNECYRVLKPGGKLCLNIPFYNFRQRFNMYVTYYEILKEIGFQDRDTITWVKLDGLEFAHSRKTYGEVSPKNPRMKYPCELISIWQKGDGKLEGEETDLSFGEFFKWSHAIWFIPPDYRRDDHPTPYPEELVYRLIKIYSFPGQKVLDPFLGSGVTLKACQRVNRQGIGIEINPSFAELAKNALHHAKINKENLLAYQKLNVRMAH